MATRQDAHEKIYAKITGVEEKVDTMLEKLGRLAEGMRWLKLAVVGIYSTFGLAIAKVVVASMSK